MCEKITSKRETLRKSCRLIEGQISALRNFLAKLDDGSLDVSLIAANLTIIQTWAQTVGREGKDSI